MYYTVKTSPTKGIRVSLREKQYVSPIKDRPYKNEIGYIHLVPMDSSKYMSVLNVELDPKFQRKGHGKELYFKALELAKKAGYDGIASHKNERTKEADYLWKSLRTKKLDGHDILGTTMEKITARNIPTGLTTALQSLAMQPQKVLHEKDSYYDYYCAYVPLKTFGEQGATYSPLLCMVQSFMNGKPMQVELSLLDAYKPPGQIAGLPLLNPDNAPEMFAELLHHRQMSLSPLEGPKADLEFLREQYGPGCKSFNGQIYIPIDPELFGIDIEVWDNGLIDTIDEAVWDKVNSDVLQATGFDDKHEYKKKVISDNGIAWAIYTL